MQRRHRLGLLLLGLGIATLVTAAAASAATGATFGPQTWSNGATSGRYRSHNGTHYIYPTQCSGSKSVELRVDKINASDISAGTKTIACNTAYGTFSSSIDSYGSQYRGHFMQNRSTSWYGALTDVHP